MKVWIVTGWDDCNHESYNWAVYSEEHLAKQHVSLVGGDIIEYDVLDCLHEDTTNELMEIRERDRRTNNAEDL